MSTTISRTDFAQTTPWTRRVFSLVERVRVDLQEWRKREELRTKLCSLNDNELQDIGIARGEIDYVVSDRANHWRGVRTTLR
jgi:uncharacterized protein YjiS (DUF1127 family)